MIISHHSTVTLCQGVGDRQKGRSLLLRPEEFTKMKPGVGGELYKAPQVSVSSWLDNFHEQLSSIYKTTKGIWTDDLGRGGGFNDHGKLRNVDDYIPIVIKVQLFRETLK